MAARKPAGKPLNEAAAKAEDGIYLDPDLIPLREAEAKRNDVEIAPREDPTVDPKLLEIRDAEIKAEARRNAELNR